jgi:hypothetical protein
VPDLSDRLRYPCCLVDRHILCPKAALHFGIDEGRVLLRILFVSRTYFPARTYGGPVTSLRHVCRLLSEAAHHVIVVCSDMASPGRHGERLRPGTLVVGGVRVRYLRTQFRYHWDGIESEALRAVPKAVADSEVHIAGSRHFLGVLAERSPQVPQTLLHHAGGEAFPLASATSR